MVNFSEFIDIERRLIRFLLNRPETYIDNFVAFWNISEESQVEGWYNDCFWYVNDFPFVRIVFTCNFMRVLNTCEIFVSLDNRVVQMDNFIFLIQFELFVVNLAHSEKILLVINGRSHWKHWSCHHYLWLRSLGLGAGGTATFQVFLYCLCEQLPVGIR